MFGLRLRTFVVLILEYPVFLGRAFLLLFLFFSTNLQEITTKGTVCCIGKEHTAIQLVNASNHKYVFRNILPQFEQILSFYSYQAIFFMPFIFI